MAEKKFLIEKDKDGLFSVQDANTKETIVEDVVEYKEFSTTKNLIKIKTDRESSHTILHYNKDRGWYDKINNVVETKEFKDEQIIEITFEERQNRSTKRKLYDSFQEKFILNNKEIEERNELKSRIIKFENETYNFFSDISKCFILSKNASSHPERIKSPIKNLYLIHSSYNSSYRLFSLKEERFLNLETSYIYNIEKNFTRRIKTEDKKYNIYKDQEEKILLPENVDSISDLREDFTREIEICKEGETYWGLYSDKEERYILECKYTHIGYLRADYTRIVWKNEEKYLLTKDYKLIKLN